MELRQDLLKYDHLWEHKATLRTSKELKRGGQKGKGREHKEGQVRSGSAQIQGKGA